MKLFFSKKAAAAVIASLLTILSSCIFPEAGVLAASGEDYTAAAAAGSGFEAKQTPGLVLGESKKVLYLGLKSRSSFTITYTLKEGLTGKVKFASDKPEIARVNSKGKVTAVSSGTARIRVTIGKICRLCIVRVRKPGLVRTSSPKASLQIGQTFQIETRMSPAGGRVTYASSNPSAARVSSAGVVTARGAGTAYISMTAYGITRKMKVNVVNRIYTPTVKTLSFSPAWPYASFSKIHTGTVKLYQSPFSKGKTVAVNAGHGTNGGSDVYTLCHPDGSPKIVSASTEAGAYYSTAVSDGTVFLDGTTEAEATLSLALLVKDRLLLAGYDVLMIRETHDQQLDNIARTVFANQYADCHIALHYDSSEYDKGAFYISVPLDSSYLSMEPVASHWRDHNRLGESLLAGFRKKQLHIYSDGTMDIDLTQTSYSTIPSVDLEVGDCASDHSQAAQARIADAVAYGVNTFFSH